MSWSCHGDSNAAMVEALRKHKKLTTPNVLMAMMATDRGNYVAPEHAGPSAAEAMRRSPDVAYVDRPQPIGHNATISAYAACSIPERSA